MLVDFYITGPPCLPPTEERKIVLRAVCVEAVLAISQCTEELIRKTNESEILMGDQIEQIWENAQRRLRTLWKASLLEREKTGEFDYHHRTRTILGSMHTAYEDLKEAMPPEATCTCGINYGTNRKQRESA